MSNITLTAALSNLLPHLASSPPNPLAEEAIRSSAIALCRDSGIWVFKTDPVDVVAGLREYDIEPQSGTDTTAVMSIHLGGVALAPMTVNDLDQTVDNWMTESGSPTMFSTFDMSSIMLVPVPDTAVPAGLTMTLSVQPKSNSASLPGWMWAKWRDVIISGALARLMAMPGKAWTDAKLAMHHDGIFQNGVAGAQTASSDVVCAGFRTTPQH